MEIYVDWGSSNFRAFLVDGGKAIDRRGAAGGGTLKNFSAAAPEKRSEAYAAFFVEQLGDWLTAHPAAPVYICGAVGGREGWVETAYSVTPAGFAEIRRNLHKIAPEKLHAAANRNIYIASGCTTLMKDGRHDVIRSEEVKSLGAAKHLGLGDALLCIPGTHCKWVEIKSGKITGFETALTGEVFNLLSENGGIGAILKANPAPPVPDAASFDAGLALAACGFDLLTDLWQVRSQKLRDPSPPQDLAAYFSGILIGHELRQMEKFYHRAPAVLLADAGAKRDFYMRGFASLQWPVLATVDSETAVFTGLAALK
ncbi:MAG: 2-dehydro-3-deoxygalactonokinase [Micavibrio sp.]|nr:2-dehydro-3-deoxygalactonokinase [Micavibrio sp.]